MQEPCHFPDAFAYSNDICHRCKARALVESSREVARAEQVDLVAPTTPEQLTEPHDEHMRRNSDRALRTSVRRAVASQADLKHEFEKWCGQQPDRQLRSTANSRED